MELTSTVYGIIAIITTAIIVIQLCLSLFLGGVGDVDIDGDGSMDFDVGAIISPKGILHFLCGSSWYLVLARYCRECNCLLWYDWLISIGVGLILSILISLLYYGLSKLAKENKIEEGEELVGRSCEIYLNCDNGNYIVNLSINDSIRELKVVSESKRNYKTGEKSVITKYEECIYYIK